ncbi:LysR family transcriptional regulator [Actinoplanes sp. NPDC023936]|uniref:LysR family transcriptional regulator n=1 Tax=Actinoplanes sp. NPDC023936 TaxID=3154910 RepID=UPI00340B87EA
MSSATEIDLRQIRHFLAVARDRNFTRAATGLGITQSALSRSIRGLEQSIGAALFERRPREVTLTETGQILLRETADLDIRASAAVARARDAGRPARLRVLARGCDSALAGRIVDGYHATAPAVPAQLSFSDPLTHPDALRAGAAEAAFLRFPYDQAGLDAEVLFTDPRVALVAQSHPLAARGRVDLADLADDPVTVPPVSTEAERAYWAAADLRPRRWRPGPDARDSLDILAVVRHGLAISFVPASMLTGVALDGLRSLTVDGLSPSLVTIAWAEDATAPALAAFVRHACSASI